MKMTVAKVAEHHGISMAAVNEIAAAIKKGGGRSAQFNHPELGGMGQWMANGMLMIGEMFNDSLKAKVAAICRDVAAELPRPSGAEVANRSDRHKFMVAAKLRAAVFGRLTERYAICSIPGIAAPCR